MSSPAPGYRYRMDGTLSGFGNSGYSWSSAVNGLPGIYLYFAATGLNPSDTAGRGFGLQLRCLSE